MKRFKSQLAASLLLIAILGQIASARQDPLQGLDQYITEAMRSWEVPGLAIAIVKDDRIVLAKGYGVRKLGDPAPVNEHTLFAIGSASKAFTAASIAMLVDEGKLKWDDPAINYLPGFQLFDPYVTRELTVRDLLCHRSGLERADILWYGSAFSREEILRRIRYLKPSWSFRSRFGYQNIMYLAAGQIVSAVSGKSWDDFVKERFFAPLGMNSSNTSVRDLARSENVATPHAKIEGKVEPIPWRNIDNIAPAGSINSSVADMAQWIRLNLNQGKFGDKQLISSGAIKEMQTPQTVIRLEGIFEKLYPEAHFLSYGLGWFLQDYRGRKIVQHGGNIDGMSALVAMMPEERLGLVILTNLNGTSLPTALMFRIFDAYLGAPQRDWSAELLKAIRALEEQQMAAQKKLEEERAKGTNPSLAMEKYAGTYEDDLYGQVKVKYEDGKLTISYGPSMIADLEHWHYDTFRARWKDRFLGSALVSFALNAQGRIEELRISAPNWPAMSFKRRQDAVAAIDLGEGDLKKFVGKYESKSPPLEISVELVGGKLRLIVPGQPTYTLSPVSSNRFIIEGLPEGFAVQFDAAQDGIRGMTLEQGPGPKLTLSPKR